MPGFMKTSPPEATLSDLQPVSLPTAGAELPAVKLARLEELYRQALAVSDDAATRLQVLHRLADIEMLQAETELATATTREAFFDAAIVAYQGLLRGNPAADSDRLLYQLSKAYELNGENEQSVAVLERLTATHPQSRHYVESKFRLAESYFSRGDYTAAEQAYAQVSARENDSVYYQNAVYMQAWSQFKQERYRAAIASFSLALDLLLPAATSGVLTDSRSGDLSALERGQRELALDSLRVLAVIFSYLEGADTIASAYERLGRRHYSHLLYQHLGELYLKQQRYRDSAETYRAFSSAWPQSEYAHSFQEKVIETYEAGGFSELIVIEKQRYINDYGVGGDYWNKSAAPARQQITPRLKLFIAELATHYHAQGQSLGTDDTHARRRGQGEAFLMTAGDYYQLFVSSFGNDPQVPQMTFMLAESRWEAGAMRAAIDAYEQVAYAYPQFPRAADAGYSAIIAYGALLEDTPPTAAAGDTLLRARIDSQLRYAGRFPGDPRAPLVLNNAAATLLELSEYQLAIIAAATLTHWQPGPDREILVPAWLVIAHSHFESGDYAPAERAYQRALNTMVPADARRAEAVERLGAAIYRQAEALLAMENHADAAEQFSRVIELAPGSSARVQAQYDAAGSYMQAGEFAEANRLLIDFRQRFPGHPLNQGVAAKLVHNYQQLQKWRQAAAELDGMSKTEQHAERRRQLLYLAAELYDKAGNVELAIRRYRTYAHNWPQPPLPRFEAMHRLGELYDQGGHVQKRLYWLRKVIATYETTRKQQGGQQSQRALYLAAFASSELAELEYLAYQRTEIRHPLAKTLNRKKNAMQRALTAWQLTNAYAVTPFSTLATYRMGEIYRGLSTELLNSERPRNLDELALEQYALLLEEQAYPFEEKAIAIHETNARRSWDGVYDEWVQHSFAALAILLPVRYAKLESGINFSRDIY
jgi:outer membrane protein assembly factor BamD (BamD/ComL family)